MSSVFFGISSITKMLRTIILFTLSNSGYYSNDLNISL